MKTLNVMVDATRKIKRLLKFCVPNGATEVPTGPDLSQEVPKKIET